MGGGRESAHVGPDLPDQGLGQATVDARDGGEPVPGVSERGQGLVDGG